MYHLWPFTTHLSPFFSAVVRIIDGSDPLPGAGSVMAKDDPSQVVRLYLASAVQRLPFAQRWSILQGLVSHVEDVTDNNLPRMYWFALEPMVPEYPRESLELVMAGTLPR